jgi:hypothetical protein
VVTILALAAAVLYGTADFLGGVASRRASVFAVLATTVPAGAAVVLVVALLGEAPGRGSLLGHGLGSPTSMGGWAVGWAAVSGICGAAGLIAFYAGFATAPISVVAPVAALVSTVLPVGIAIAGGERLTSRMLAGGLICLVAIAGVSMPAARRGRQGHRDGRDAGAARLRGLAYGAAAGAGFGLFFLCLKNAGQSGVLWPWRSRGRREPWSPGRRGGHETRPWRDGNGRACRALSRGGRRGRQRLLRARHPVACSGLAVVITSLPGHDGAVGAVGPRRADALAPAGRPAAVRGRGRAADYLSERP